MGYDRYWNLFDLFLVLSSIFDEIAQNDVRFRSVRLARGLRLFRALRVIRVVRFFRDLRLMVCMITQSLWSLSWAFLLLLMIMYVFSILLMQGVIMHLRENLEVARSEVEGELAQRYGSILQTLYTLLGSITGGLDWLSATDCLERLSPLYQFVFAVYVFFTVIGVLNVLTGIFVERANELTGLDRDLVVQSEFRRNEMFVEGMTRIFQEADKDGSGGISWEEFRSYLKNARVKAYLAR